MTTEILPTLPSFHPAAMRMIRALPTAMGVPALRAFNLYLRRKSRYVVRTDRGFLLACSPRQLIQVCIMQFGQWEPDVSALIERLVTQGTCAVDVGANIGYDTLLMARQVGPGGRVVAFEASHATHAALRANLALNGAAHVRAECLAIADEAGELVFYAGDANNDGSATLRQGAGRAVAGRVRAMPLHEALAPDEVGAVAFMKIDVEGAEAGILGSLLANIDRYEALHSVLVEFSSFDERPAWAAIWDGMARLGFAAYHVDNDYSYAAYLRWRRPAPPRRLSALPTSQADILFTRLAPAAIGAA